ncbi:hypothetical protein WMY93_018794 [Mugilogobius chulae]|uniref:Clathrin heavy chain linker domain-containing protein 1 n=1 Tax=Mugilogobius chulae TaxID=88201 RepID=A0AAW0NV43_9GOBI
MITLFGPLAWNWRTTGLFMTPEASSLQPRSLEACQTRAVCLKDRWISILHQENAELEQEIERQKSLREQSMWIAGLTVAESENSERLDKHVEQLQSRRAALLEEKSRCVLQRSEYKRLRCVYEHLCSWREEKQHDSSEELLHLLLHKVINTTVSEDDLLSLDTELLESEEPTGVNESEYLTKYLDRFVELFDSAQFREAAQHAALSPGGLMRNIHTVRCSKVHTLASVCFFFHVAVMLCPCSCSRPTEVTIHQHSPAPLLLLFHALLISTPVGQRLPESVSYECVCCALEQGNKQLITHAFMFDKLTYSERLGDVLAQYAQKNSSVYYSDMLLSLATVNYKACGSHRNMALSMSRRGLSHCTVDFMRRCKELTAEDYLWVFCQHPSLCLLQLLTMPEGGGAMLSVGVTCTALFSDTQLQEFALQLLDSLVKKGPGVLEAAILEDEASTVDEWNEIASVCSAVNRSDLSHTIVSILLSQSGTEVVSSDPEGALLTQHIFM